MVLYLLACALFLSFSLRHFLPHLFPGQDIIRIFCGLILYYFSLDILMRFMLQELPVLSIQPYLGQNIRRRQLVRFLNVRSLFQFFNLLPVFIFIPFIVTEIGHVNGPLAAACFIIAILAITLFNHFLILYIKRKLIINSWWLVGFLGVVGIELEVADYLLKPVPFPHFLKAVQRVLHLQTLPPTPVAGDSSPAALASVALQTPPPGTSAEDDLAADYFFVKTELKGKMLKINFKDIDYIEAMKNYVAIHHDGNKTLALLNMKDLEDRLPTRYFMRVHRSYIIALEKINAIEGNMVQLHKVKESILLGETYKASFLERMKDKIMQ